MKYRIITALIVIAAVLAFTGSERAMAASASLTFSAASYSVHVGDSVPVTLEISGEVVPGAFMGYIIYDSDVLEYTSGPECIAGGEGVLRISDEPYEAEHTSRKYVLYFTAVERGSCEISMRGTPEIYEYDSGYLMSTSSNSVTITVEADVKASSEARLATMKMSPGTLDPEFSSDIYEYSVTVPNACESVIISAYPMDSSAVVGVEGEKNLSVGQNRVLVKVTAEDGTEGKYVIYVARLEAEAEEGGDGTDTEQDGTQTDDTYSGIAFYAQDGPNGELFLYSDVRYRICGVEAGVTIPEGFYKTSIIISGHSVTAYSSKDDASTEYLLLVLEREGGEPDVYCYDRTEKTIQRYSIGKAARAAETASGYATLDDGELAAGYQKTLGSLTLVIAVLSGVAMLLLIITIRLSIRRKNDDL